MKVVIAMCFSILWAGYLPALTVETVKVRPNEDMTRADINFASTVQNPRAVLVLCPGFNGDGMGMIKDETWQSFAMQHDLGLVSLSFASDPEVLKEKKGYPFAEKGSGTLLLNAIREHYKMDLPLLIYGFSSGAMFSELLANWMPNRVLGWAAHGCGFAGPHVANGVPGLVSCGERDIRYGDAMMYFKNGRAVGKPLLWLGLANLDHATSKAQESLVREFFSAVLEGKVANGEWVDIDRKLPISEEEANSIPSLSGWLPDRQLLARWKEVHTP
ncbi:hypothetical protein DB345_05200 [Spartobacteria bacterium LR76]|nr:hypothetical protein DB345_05200 [Spartobacteria bacterium LR76]